jgi:hypothetical protein
MNTRLLVITALVASAAVTAGSAAAQPLLPQMHTVAGGGSCTTPIEPPPTTPPTTLPCNNAKPTSIPINDARSVAALPDGSYLYVDEYDDLVQQVSHGTVTIVAGGNPSCSYANGNTCDGMAATSVELDDPVSVAPLSGGGFLVTEHHGSRVLMVSPSGTITTIAGTGTPGPDSGPPGLATSIPLNYPSDAEPTADGGVLIANSGSDDIRYVAPDGVISTVAGGGTCDGASCSGFGATQVKLHQPASVSPIQGGFGGYLIANYGNDAIDEVSQISPLGTFTTVAGTPGQAGFAGDGGPATSAQLNLPKQVVSLPAGGFLIADTNNEVIRQVTPSGMITTIAGTPGLASFGGDGGAATAASFDSPAAVSQLPKGNLLIADEDDGLIREITLPSVSTFSFSPSAPNGGNGWYTSSVTAKVSANEGATVSCILDPALAPPAFGAIPAGCSFTGAGGSISGDGIHTLYAASMNSFGDQEDPVSAVVMIDTTPPRLTCNGQPSFRAGAGNARVTATVTDAISGPVSPVVSARANTSNVGLHRVILHGANNAGFGLDLFCIYMVTPLTLKPAPSIHWTFATTGSTTVVQRLVVSNVATQAEVNVTCTGTGCPFSSAKNVTGAMCGAKPCTAPPKVRRHRRTVDVTALLAHSQLQAGARFSISVTKKNTLGGLWQFQARSGKSPSHRAGCLKPGSSQRDPSCKP